MSFIDDVVAKGVNAGMGYLLGLGKMDAATASKGLIMAGQAQIDLGNALADGTLTQDEIDKILTELNNFEGGVFGTMVKSAISRMVEIFATKK